jgi:hypothetical protein
MAVTAKLYGPAVMKMLNKEIDWDTDSIKVMLCTSAYTPDQDAHAYKAAVTGEVVGTGYSSTGAALTGATLTYTAGNNTIKLDANDVSWPASSFTARYAVIYDASPATDSARPLIAFVDFGIDFTVSGGAFDIIWDAAGIATFVVA